MKKQYFYTNQTSFWSANKLKINKQLRIPLVEIIPKLLEYVHN